MPSMFYTPSSLSGLKIATPSFSLIHCVLFPRIVLVTCHSGVCPTKQRKKLREKRKYDRECRNNNKQEHQTHKKKSFGSFFVFTSKKQCFKALWQIKPLLRFFCVIRSSTHAQCLTFSKRKTQQLIEGRQKSMAVLHDEIHYIMKTK